MQEDGILKIISGITDFEEVESATGTIMAFLNFQGEAAENLVRKPCPVK